MPNESGLGGLDRAREKVLRSRSSLFLVFVTPASGWLVCGIRRNGKSARTRRSHTISTKVFVGNLNFRTTQQQLSDTFSEVGHIVSVYMPTDRETGRPRGFAFVEFSSSDEAQQAIGRFDGQELDGRKLRVNLAEQRPERSSGAPRPRSSTPTVGWAAGAGAPPYREEPRNFKTKGSRRNLRARKRSLNY